MKKKDFLRFIILPLAFFLLCAVVINAALYVGLRVDAAQNGRRFEGPVQIANGEPTVGPGYSISLPHTWQNTPVIKVHLETGRLMAGEAGRMQISVGMHSDLLGEGTLHIEVRTTAFSVSFSQGDVGDGRARIENFSFESYTEENPLRLTATLRPDAEKLPTHGEDAIYFYYEPYDRDAFCQQVEAHWTGHIEPDWDETYFKEDGQILLRAYSFDYAMTAQEIRFAQFGDDAMLCDMLADHYYAGLVSREELIALHREWSPYVHEDDGDYVVMHICSERCRDLL